MELHSYAKRRTLKKWTIEQKRKLVEARIAHDAWFTNKPSSLVPWKNILITANLDDFNVCFVRKQWSNMLARYKQYKQTFLGSNTASKAIDAELIKRINQEWEFFEPIHTFMTRKTTNLHSYALTHRTDNNTGDQPETNEELVNTSTVIKQEQETPEKLLNNETVTTISLPKYCAKENIPNNATIIIQSNNISQNDDIHLFSSDTNEEFEVIAETTRIINGGSKPHQISKANVNEEDENMNCVRNTDHDFYSKRSTLGAIANVIDCNEEDELQEKQSNYFADASEESQGSLILIGNLLQMNNKPTNVVKNSNKKAANDNKFTATKSKSENKSHYQSLGSKEVTFLDQEYVNQMPSTSAQGISKRLTNTTHTSERSSKTELNERDKYYRHKRHFNRRLEKRFDALLQVMSQIVKTEYPNVDVMPLVNTVTSLASGINKVLSSDSEDDVQSDDSNANIPKATQVNK